MLALPLVLGLAATAGAGAARAGAVVTGAAATGDVAATGGAVAVGAPVWLAACLVPPAMALLFLSRYAAMSVASRLIDGRQAPEGFLARRGLWSAIYLGGAVLLLATAWQMVPHEARRHALYACAVTLGLGGLHTLLALVGRDRTGPGELVGMAGLSSAATLVMTMAGHPLGRPSVGVAMLALVYFASSLAYVRAYRLLQKGDTSGRKRAIAAHAMIVYAIGVLAAGGFIPLLAAAAFVPVFGRTIQGFMAPPKNLAVLGWREVVVASLFVAIAVVAYLL
jgi:hypothetical protein